VNQRKHVFFGGAGWINHELNIEEATRELIRILDVLLQREEEGETRWLLGSLFYRPSTWFDHIINRAEMALLLKELVQRAYQIIHPSDDEDDKSRSGIYRPTQRHKAESARSTLVSTLTSLSGATAYNMLIELSETKAARDSEPASYTVNNISKLIKENELPPHDRDSLFRVMMERLSDIQHDLDNHDFSIKERWRECTKESQVQELPAKELDDKRRNAYMIQREVEVINDKKPDLLLSTTDGNNKAVIEMKYANNWTINKLEKALNDQLVDQYLKHDSCRVGCLFLSLHKHKEWDLGEGENKQRINFKRLIRHLKEKAERLEVEYDGSIRLNVFGLDLINNKAV